MLEVLKDYKQIGGMAVERASISAPGNVCIYDDGNQLAFKLNSADLSKEPANGCFLDTMANALLLLVEKSPKTPNSEKVRLKLIGVVNTLFDERKAACKPYLEKVEAERVMAEKAAKEEKEKAKLV